MKRQTISILTLLAAVVIPAETRADYSNNFNNQSDAGLAHYNPLAGVAGLPGGSYAFPQLGPGNFGYELTSPGVSSSLVPVVGEARVGSLYTGQVFANFSVSADVVRWDDSLGEAFGLAARISNPGLGTSDGYGAFYVTAAGNGGTGLLLIDRFTDEGITTLVQTNLTLDPTKSYRISFTGIGTDLSARLVGLSDPGVTLASVSTTDSAYSTGVAGLIAGANLGTPTSAIDVTFDNLAISSVPEPSTLAMLGVGLFGIMGYGWRRRKSS